MQDRLTMPIGNAIFTQRSTRKLRPDPIPVEDLHLLMEAAVKAPNGGNNQVGRFLIVNDRAKIREFGALYKEAWWAKRWDDHKWTKPEDIPLTDKNHRSAMGLSEDMKDVPCVVFAFTAPGGGANSVIPACQNLMLAAHALGIGSLPDHAARQGDGPLPRDVRHPQGDDVPLLHPARLPGREVRPEQAEADRGDHLAQQVGRSGPVAVTRKPAVSLAAVPGRRKATVEMAKRLEEEGFTGLYCPSLGDGLGLCEAIALATRTIPFGTSIANIYTRHALDFAQTAALIHELSGGRFRFGVGISHGPTHDRLGIKPGKPLEDMRRFVQDLKAGAKQAGELPPITLATLRKKMTALSAEIAQGAVWANAARSHMPESLKALPDAARTGPDFFIGNMVPTCIDTDRAAAAAVNRRTLTGYVKLPNYQNYWIEAGFEDEMQAIRKAIAAGQDDKIPSLMSDRWLSQVTLYGSASEVRDGVEAWYAAGVKTLIVVPSSAKGNQMAALQELIDLYR